MAEAENGAERMADVEEPIELIKPIEFVRLARAELREAIARTQGRAEEDGMDGAVEQDGEAGVGSRASLVDHELARRIEEMQKEVTYARIIRAPLRVEVTAAENGYVLTKTGPGGYRTQVATTVAGVQKAIKKLLTEEDAR